MYLAASICVIALGLVAFCYSLFRYLKVAKKPLSLVLMIIGILLVLAGAALLFFLLSGRLVLPVSP